MQYILYDRLSRDENGNMEYWEGINYTIEEGRIIQDPVISTKQLVDKWHKILFETI